LTTFAGIGHALNSRIVQPLAETILNITGERRFVPCRS
jgi:hypothetical protein